MRFIEVKQPQGSLPKYMSIQHRESMDQTAELLWILHMFMKPLRTKRCHLLLNTLGLTARACHSTNWIYISLN